MALTSGAIAGLAATVPMTMTMVTLHHFPRKDPLAIPPKRVAGGIAKKLHINKDMDATEKESFTWLSHFAFGAAAGEAYSRIISRPDSHPVAKGVAFGMAVWAGSYMGWAPLLGITRFPTKEPNQQVAVQVVSHIVWGAALGYLANKIKLKPMSV